MLPPRIDVPVILMSHLPFTLAESTINLGWSLSNLMQGQSSYPVVQVPLYITAGVQSPQDISTSKGGKRYSYRGSSQTKQSISSGYVCMKGTNCVNTGSSFQHILKFALAKSIGYFGSGNVFGNRLFTVQLLINVVSEFVLKLRSMVMEVKNDAIPKGMKIEVDSGRS